MISELYTMSRGRQKDPDDKLGRAFYGSKQITSVNSCSLPYILDVKLGNCLGISGSPEHACVEMFGYAVLS